MKGPIADHARLLHISEAIDYVQDFLKNKSKDDFLSDTMLRFAVERQLEIIGEAANHLSDDLKENFNEIEWRKIVSFRNFLVHEYFGIDIELVWDIATTKLLPLQTVVRRILEIQ